MCLELRFGTAAVELCIRAGAGWCSVGAEELGLTPLPAAPPVQMFMCHRLVAFRSFFFFLGFFFFWLLLKMERNTSF